MSNGSCGIERRVKLHCHDPRQHHLTNRTHPRPQQHGRSEWGANTDFVMTTTSSRSVRQPNLQGEGIMSSNKIKRKGLFPDVQKTQLQTRMKSGQDKRWKGGGMRDDAVQNRRGKLLWLDSGHI
jgi:hypothetical protein